MESIYEASQVVGWTRPTKKLIEFQEGPPTTNHFPLDFLVNLQFVFIELLYSRSYNTTRKSGQTKSLPCPINGTLSNFKTRAKF